MASATDLVSNKGDANLGVGSNAGIPLGTDFNLDVINKTGEQIMLQNMNQNREIYQQKLRERDQLLSQIDSGGIKVGDLLEEDTPIVKEGLDNLDKAWEEMVTKGKNDLDAQRKYKKALRDAQDRTTQAQARKVYFDQEAQELSKETLPRKQTARKQNLDGVIKGGFWKDLTPYQQTQDLDIEKSILSTAANVTEQFTDPKNPLIKGKRTIFDYDKTLQSNNDNFLNDANKRHDQEQLVASIQSLPPQDFVENLQAMNNRIADYNKTKGLIEGQPGFVAAVDFEIDPQTGKPAINEKLPDFAAKYTLTRQKPFSSTETAFDKDRAAYELGRQRNAIAQQNANAGTLRARTYSQVQQKKLSQMDADEKRVMGIWPKIIGKVKTAKSGTGSDVDVVWSGDLPSGYKNINGLDKDGKPMPLKPFKNKQGQEYFTNKYYDANGGEIDLRAQYNEYKAAGGRGSYDDLRNKLLKSGNVNMEMQGSNGTADFNSAMETARALSNKLGSGKEEPVFSETTTIEEEE